MKFLNISYPNMPAGSLSQDTIYNGQKLTLEVLKVGKVIVKIA